MGRLLIAVLAVLPKHLMSHFAGWLANRPVPRRFRPAVYRGYSRVFGARPEEAELALADYPTINAFFTRGLKPGLRPIAANAIVSPADAAVGAWGPVADDTLIQAKGRNYSLAGLVADASIAHRLDGGTFAALYLAPRDYHRFHLPVDGAVTAATYVPGELWPVNTHAVAHVADLFAVNERIVVTIERPGGALFVVVLVGATMVGMTRLAFDHLHTNARRREIQHHRYEPPLPARAGAPLGHFEFGSTIILIASPQAGAIDPLDVGQVLRVGERIGYYAGPTDAPRSAVPPAH